MLDVVFISIELGLLYSIAVFGVFLTFRVLDFPDLTADGSFVTGAALTALGITSGIPASAAVALGAAGGFLCGVLTALLHVQFGISKILSGILSLGMLYTVNLRLMRGPNISLLNEPVFSWLKAPVHHAAAILILIGVSLAIKLAIDWFLRTEIGLYLRATGTSEATVRSLSMNPSFTKFLGLGIGNALVALSGGFVAQNQGFADVNMGIGIIILGLASLMLGEALVARTSVRALTLAVLVGTVAYELVINLGLRLGLAATDLKFVTALIVVCALLLQRSNRYVARGIFGN